MGYDSKAYIEEHKDRFLEELFELLRIPSISTSPEHKEEVQRAAENVKQRLEKAGADRAEIHSTPGHPIVFGEKRIGEDAPTVLVYGHYDVQPPDPEELWETAPFEPTVRNEEIYARGACDDKGQMYMHIKAFELMMEQGGVPCNIKFIFEGEEEIGSAHLDEFVQKNKELLAADVVLVSDTAMLANDTPSITTGIRGISYMEVELTGPNRDLHSGIYGGCVANPINKLAEMIASLKDEKGRITIPGFYDDVQEVPDKERKAFAEAPFDLERYKDELGIREVEGEEGFTTLERGAIRPTLDCNGIWGGYQEEGAKTVLPSKAGAKISMRLVPDQDSQKISELFRDHIERITPKSVHVKVTEHHGGEAAVTPIEHPGYKAAHQAMAKSFGKEPIPLRSGGTIPIVHLFEKELGIKTILMGFGLDSDAIHSPNEKFGLFNYYKGIETIPYFHEEFSKAWNG